MTDEPLKPLLANCSKLELLAPIKWIALGWKDCLRTPKCSAFYGLFVVIISYIVFSFAWYFSSITLALGLLSSFIFVAPILCLGLYSVAMHLSHDREVNFRKTIKHGIRPYGDLLIFVIMMIVLSLIWARAASMIHIFFPVNPEAKITDLAIFLGVGSAVGSIFAFIIFSISVFSLPMIMDKDTDMVTACVSSVNAVLRNKSAMLFWSMIIVIFIAIGILTAFLGFLIIFPLLGYATWHGYEECLDVTPWETRNTDFVD